MKSQTVKNVVNDVIIARTAALAAVTAIEANIEYFREHRNLEWSEAFKKACDTVRREIDNDYGISHDNSK